MYKSFPKRVSALIFFFVAFTALARAVDLTPRERAWLAEHGGVIRFASTQNYPPFEFVGENGES